MQSGQGIIPDSSERLSSPKEKNFITIYEARKIYEGSRRNRKQIRVSNLLSQPTSLKSIHGLNFNLRKATMKECVLKLEYALSSSNFPGEAELELK